MAPAYQHPSQEEKAEYVRQLFDQIAENYDAMNPIMSAGQWEKWHKAFLEIASYQPGMQVLDLACGTGDLTMLGASQVAPTGHVTGADFSEGMLEVGRRRVAQTPYNDLITLEWGNAVDLKYAEHTFDMVTMGWAMRNVPSIEKTLSEVYRVLKPGGRFVCMDSAKPYSKILRAGFMLYFKTFLPMIDWFVVKTGREAKVRPYTYLSRSLDNYPFPNELEKMFQAAGFKQTDYRLLMMGTVAIHVGTK
ncbi:MAG TPA: bifunctional demethylmenaquinone methyltransferase/2-methoxy-6-polyprenyl-1,4-benzoquinol methylase UbiE [Symbiobacteriaceae bacterium]|nr:bifunctional demethylmenaquinone methyltransferase/2-methoxy-6-polyprenyl-1,4-benzoquinol methylase UbiE [Symbiobacteriaceae bacterium]